VPIEPLPSFFPEKGINRHFCKKKALASYSYLRQLQVPIEPLPSFFPEKGINRHFCKKKALALARAFP